MPARLLHESPLHLARTDEGLAQRCSQRLDLDRDVVLLLEGAGQQRHVRRPHGPQHDLVGLGVEVEAHRHVLGHQGLQDGCELVLIALAASVDRHRQQRFRQHPRFDQGWLLRRGQRVRGLGTGEARHEDEFTRDPMSLGPGLITQRGGEHPDSVQVLVVVGVPTERTRRELLQMPGDVHGIIGPQRPREDPHERLPPDELVRGRAHDLGDEWPGGIARHGTEVATVRPPDLRQGTVHR